ncbi:MAG TPA: alkaline phosphatase family protein [Candidatus Baltobacteraceae bacterium]|nr:alkaline phosphatase family protein [Candidatus Baltobacteraceae bacterium]
MVRRIALGLALTLTCAASVTAARNGTILPTGWRLTAPQGPVAATGTMPQGLSVSPDGTMLAVVESGTNPAAVRVFDLPGLQERMRLELPGAFGAPVWDGNSNVLVAGANSGAVLSVDVAQRSFSKAVTEQQDQWPAAVARDPKSAQIPAAVNDGDGTVRIRGTAVRVGAHPVDIAFSADGATAYVSVRQDDTVAVIDTAGPSVVDRIHVGRHPGALALSDDGKTLYVAESDDDSVGIINTAKRARTGGIDVGLHVGSLQGPGASPNALLVHGNDLFVSLGAENAVALVRSGKVVERIPAGWYPTGVALGSDGTLYVSNGYGERSPANPQFDPFKHGAPGYIASITVGSVRAIPHGQYDDAEYETQQVIADARRQWTAPAQTIVHAGGPIRHVIYIIKENRTYDQVLGDVAGANGDSHLASFGEKITPNQHAIAKRFGVFDNAYADAQVSAPGHNWTDAAFSNDFVERFWPPSYGGRLQSYGFQSGSEPDVPHSGYLWDDAARAHLTYRDYGEDIDFAPKGPKIGVSTFPGLAGHFDPAYVGWDLTTSDLDRYAEWQREFDKFAAAGTLPSLEIVYLPNDHTSGSRPGSPTPQAYVAINDQAVGKLIDHVSHSKYWSSTAIFVLEDDAQNGPDHVSGQRSTFYIASPYARGGVQHEHYSTSSFVRTIELLLGMKPLSIYDATARPLYSAFALKPVNGKPFALLPARTDVHAVNLKTAYGAQRSARLDFSRPDAADEDVLNDVLSHVR